MTSLPDGEDDLVRRCLAGESAAVTDLIARFRTEIYSLCVRMLRHHQDAEDVSQEIFLRVVRNLNRWDATRPLRPWIMTIAVNSVSLSLSGTINDGDQFTVGPTPAGTADNRNALLLSALQTSKALLGGTATFEGAYAQLVSFVGNTTREAKVAANSQETQLIQAKAAEQSFSGVNLDEEAGDLLRYQQAYQAAAKVISIAGKLFDELLSIGR